MEYTQRDIERFMSKVKPDGECLVWTSGASETRGGYGQFGHKGKNWLPHRWVWSAVKGEIPKGMVVMHLCDNPPCVRLEHLQLGTQSENMRDMVTKGRHGRKVSGSNNGKAKLTDAQVHEIRTLYGRFRGYPNARELAEQFGVSESLILMILNDQRRQARDWAGEKNPHAKITQAQAAEIRQRYRRNGSPNGVELAREYGLDHTTIYAILHGRRWAS